VKITYDPEGDVLYIQLREESPTDSTDIEEGVTAELDSRGHLVAVEILDASQRLTPEELTNMSYENPLLASAPGR
jgi:uncharacterized protein YuzE